MIKFRFRLVREKTHIDFMGLHKVAFFLSAMMMVATLALFLMRGLNYGIDFTGGILMEVKMPAGTQIEQVRGMLGHLESGMPTIQEFGADSVMIKIPGKEADAAGQKAIYAEVAEKLGGQAEVRRVEYVGPQVGDELIKKGVLAFFWSVVGILAYIWFRYEWQFGVTGVIALFHGLCATMLFFILTRIEFDLATVAAVLLIAGYAINDMVVVFDRIREMLRKYRKMPLPELLNLSVNDTLARTLMTSMTTLLAMIALALFGGEVIKGFTYAMIVGILVGTYSSIFVAAPLLIYMNLRREAPAEAEAGAA